MTTLTGDAFQKHSAARPLYTLCAGVVRNLEIELGFGRFIKEQVVHEGSLLKILWATSRNDSQGFSRYASARGTIFFFFFSRLCRGNILLPILQIKAALL